MRVQLAKYEEVDQNKNQVAQEFLELCEAQLQLLDQLLTLHSTVTVRRASRGGSRHITSSPRHAPSLSVSVQKKKGS